MSSVCEPLVLPIKDVRVNSTVPDSFMKGIPAQIGDAEQQIVLMPWPDLNNSWIYDEQAFCDPTRIFSDTICFVRRGSYYLEDESSTFEQALDVTSAGGAPIELVTRGTEAGVRDLLSSSLGGTDTIKLGSHAPIERYPLGIPRIGWDGGYTTLHALGFGSNSTYLNALLEAGSISAKVWSMFWGRMWATPTPMDGSVVLGGYDRAKIIGRNFTRSLDYGPDGCWTGMRIDIHDIRVNFRTGGEESLFPTNSILPVCLVPQRQLLLEAPGTVFDNFENVTATQNIGVSFGLHWGAQLFDTGTHFDGDITFELEEDFSIRVPNDQWVVPFVTVERNSSRIFNESQREVLIGRLGTEPPTLGRYFLTAAYLMVDQDAGTFTLWRANPSEKQDLVAVTNDRPLARCEEDSSITQPSSPAQSGSTAAKPTLSRGAIAGTVVGVLAFIAAILLIALLVRRQRKRRIQYTTAPQEVSAPYEVPGSYPHKTLPATAIASDAFDNPKSVSVGGGVLQELISPGSNRFVYELDGNRRSSQSNRERDMS